MLFKKEENLIFCVINFCNCLHASTLHKILSAPCTNKIPQNKKKNKLNLHVYVLLQIPGSLGVYVETLNKSEAGAVNICLIGCMMQYLTASKSRTEIEKYLVRFDFAALK